MIIEKIPNRTLVRIVKPTIRYGKWRRSWKEVGWDQVMDMYNGRLGIIASCYTYNDYIHYTLKDYIHYFHGDWLKIISKDENGNPEPYDNEGKSNCYWCNNKTKLIKQNLETRVVTFCYCPKCKR